MTNPGTPGMRRGPVRKLAEKCRVQVNPKFRPMLEVQKRHGIAWARQPLVTAFPTAASLRASRLDELLRLHPAL